MSKSLIIARPYAKAVFAIALEQQALEAWSSFLQIASGVIQAPAVQALLSNPKISVRRIGEFLLTVCSPQAVNYSENFLKLLGVRHRFEIIPQVAQLFEAYKAQQQKLASVQVTSALPLSSAEQAQLVQKLQKCLQRQIIVAYTVDPAIIGGLIVQAADLVIDGSVRCKLVRLKARLLN